VILTSLQSVTVPRENDLRHRDCAVRCSRTTGSRRASKVSVGKPEHLCAPGGPTPAKYKELRERSTSLRSDWGQTPTAGVKKLRTRYVGPSVCAREGINVRD